MQSISIFADGACSQNPGPGGWGVIIATPQGEITELGGFDPETTNNKMELAAVGKALRHLEKTPGPITIYTDSVYVINGMTKWIWGWMKNGWKTAEGKEVANAEYWKRLQTLVIHRKRAFPEADLSLIEFKYVRGHSGIPGNERVDEIAVAFSKGKRPALFRGPLLKYSIPIFDLPEESEMVVPERTSNQSKEKKPAFSYLSLVGHEAKRHSTWAECEARVKGVSGAKFKKTMSEAEEQEILKSWGAKLKD